MQQTNLHLSQTKAMEKQLTYKDQIEILINEWHSISSACQWAKWAEKVRATKFGTYGTISIFDVIENTEVKFINEWVKSSFINECNDALKNINYL